MRHCRCAKRRQIHLVQCADQLSRSSRELPFCTIDANVGIVAVPDDRLEIISRIVKVREKVPATLEFVDIAGLVEGASQGEGLGNRFLANIREMDVIAYVASAFGSDDSIDVQAVTDQFDMLKTELMIADLDTVRNSFDKSVRRASTGDKEQKRVLGAIKRVGLAIEKGIEVKDVDLTGQEREDLRDLFLLTAKPAFHIVNIGENQLATGTGDLEQAVGNSIVAVCAKIEAELADLDEEDRDSFRDTPRNQALSARLDHPDRLFCFGTKDFLHFQRNGDQSLDDHARIYRAAGCRQDSYGYGNGFRAGRSVQNSKIWPQSAMNRRSGTSARSDTKANPMKCKKATFFESDSNECQYDQVGTQRNDAAKIADRRCGAVEGAQKDVGVATLKPEPIEERTALSSSCSGRFSRCAIPASRCRSYRMTSSSRSTRPA